MSALAFCALDDIQKKPRGMALHNLVTNSSRYRDLHDTQIVWCHAKSDAAVAVHGRLYRPKSLTSPESARFLRVPLRLHVDALDSQGGARAPLVVYISRPPHRLNSSLPPFPCGARLKPVRHDQRCSIVSDFFGAPLEHTCHRRGSHGSRQSHDSRFYWGFELRETPRNWGDPPVSHS